MESAVPTSHMLVMLVLNLANVALYKNEQTDLLYYSMPLFIAVLAG